MAKEEVPADVAMVTSSGFQMVTAKVVEESENYYIAKDGEGKIVVKDKSECRVDVIAFSSPIN